MRHLWLTLVPRSGDFIYSFDLIKSPDARDEEAKQDEAFRASRLRHRSVRKRKRKPNTVSSSSATGASGPPHQIRRVPDDVHEDGSTAMRVRYENGDVQDIPVTSQTEMDDTSSNASDLQGILLSETQRVADSIARGIVQLRRALFEFSAALGSDTALAMESSSELTPFRADFTSTLGQAASLLPQMDEVIRGWSYPVNPTADEVVIQNGHRHNRQASWRLVQAAGCLSRVCGGRLQTLSSATDPRVDLFRQIKPAVHEGRSLPRESVFCYDFLKAILLWLEEGHEAVAKGFVRPPSAPVNSTRYPASDVDDTETALQKISEYLTNLANQNTPIIDLDSNRFEVDESRHVFPSQKAAVQAFSRALIGIELRLHQGQPAPATSSSSNLDSRRVMDKGAAVRFWAVKVGRSLLMQAAEGVNFDTTLRAFGGIRVRIEAEESESVLDEIDPEMEERVVTDIDLISVSEGSSGVMQDSASPQAFREPHTVVVQEAGEADEDDDAHVGDQSSDDEAEESDSDDEPTAALFRRRIGFGRSRERASVNVDVPYSSHTRVYKGHCNTRTVKDVNYYGLDDEYVVSGSDDGHFFIWDRRTGEIVNILRGDGEVVNVVQGHPYEPMIACSGIDSTIKVFAPSNLTGGESRERHNAARGIDIANPGVTAHSSMRFGARRREENDVDSPAEQDEQESPNEDDDDDAVESPATRRGLRSRRAIQDQYRITSANDEERRSGGMGEAFVTVSDLEMLDQAVLTRLWLLNSFGGVR
jgi:DDB1- and CUL4-associated factor 6